MAVNDDIRAELEELQKRSSAKRTVLDEAADIIHGARQAEYGGPAESFGRIAEMWSAYFGGDRDFTGYDVALMMILLKVSRAGNGLIANGKPQRDSIVDVIGYAGCIEILAGEL